MRFLWVRADSFGPFPPNETLHFAPRMNVVFGNNEAGKSSWHAAIYAGLCGMRRRQGRPEPADQLFADRHRPWGDDGSGTWVVTAVVELQDGKQIELRHDLATRTARVTDATLGRPYELEITHDGAPDGARLVGLDRRAFLATACVRQGDLLAVRESSAHLQQYLQRAVATGREDATVIGAIEAIDRYHDEFVGTNRANSRKPWRAAIDTVDRGERELEGANRQHEEYLLLIAQAEELRDRADAARRQLALVLARQAAAESERLQERLARARVLQELFPAGPPPAGLDDDTLANSVAGALAAWAARPPEAVLTGATAADLQVQMEALPRMPEGDLQPEPSVQLARERLRDAIRAMEQHADLEPRPVDVPDGGGLSEGDLRALAFDLRREVVSVDPAFEERCRQAREALSAGAGKASSKALVVGGATLAGLGLAMVLATPVIGGALLAAGAVLVGLWVISNRNRWPSVAALADLQAAERTLVEQQMRAEESRRVREAAVGRARAAGLTPDAGALEALAASLAAGQLRLRERDAWEDRHRQLQDARTHAEGELQEALRARGVQPGADLLADAERYETACRQRDVIAGEARRRLQIEEQLATRETAERSAQDSADRRREAAEGVLQAAARCGLSAEAPEQAVDALRSWQNDRAQRLAELDAQRADWTDLQTLLDRRTLQQLETEAEERRALAEKYAESLPSVELNAVTLEPDVTTQVGRLRSAFEGLDREHAQLLGRIQTEAGRLASVPAAVEALDAAKLELQRVERLRQTLNLTKTFLETAQDRVHRDIAPVLSESVARRLPQVTGGRYREVTVDPQDLNVRVRLPSGSLQPAYLLSHGTAEQMYLLLRVAMAERLCKPEEACPLVLDDATVQSDAERTVCILDTLHALSSERQIILFSQEEEVLRWAETHLPDGGRDRLYRLPPIKNTSRTS